MNYTWNLEDIYPSWEAWEQDFQKMKKDMEIIPNYQGKIHNSRENFVEMTKLEESLSRLVDKLYLYPYLMKDLNSKDEVASMKLQEMEAIFTDFGVKTAWTVPETLMIPEHTMKQWILEDDFLKDYAFPLQETYRLQKHVLSEEKEQLLSYFSQYLGAPDDIYSELSISDMEWKTVKLSNGWEGPITNGMYSKILSTNRNQEDRKLAFEALYEAYHKNKNTYGAIYRSLLQRGVASSRARNYSSTLEKALEGKNIPKEVFLSLLDSALKNTAPLQRYAKLRKKVLGLKEYHYYDNSISLLEYDREFPYEEAKQLVIDSVLPLGEEYQNKIKTALSDGWLDVMEKENKRSGAYSINIYDVHPYMLLNYQGTLDDVFTLAHELGHTMHSILSTEHQPFATHSYTIFVAEVASTFNERLLLDSMLEKTKDPKERIILLEQALGNIVGTYYIQTLFANYEYQAHQLVERGEAVTPDILSGIMEQLFKQYFGDTLVFDELQKIIWSRIPHFYHSPYYVYQYATSFAASANLYKQLKTNPESVTKYLRLLQSGGNDYPMEQLKRAGADLSKVESFDAIAEEFNRLLDLLEKELENYQA